MSSAINSILALRHRNAMKLLTGFATALTLSAISALSMASPASAGALTDQCAGGGGGDFCTANINFLTNGLAFWGLIICVIGVMVSAVLWALGSKGQNPGQELTGKRGFIVCFAGAFAIGAVVPIINFMDRQARTIATPAVSSGGGGGMGANIDDINSRTNNPFADGANQQDPGIGRNGQTNARPNTNTPDPTPPPPAPAQSNPFSDDPSSQPQEPLDPGRY